jgi:hypothetical protein
VLQFHSDSERSLGPVVASLSLGCVAEMYFRLHSKYNVSGGPRKVAMSLVLRHVGGTIVTSNRIIYHDSAGRCSRHGRSRRARVLRVSLIPFCSAVLKTVVSDRHAVIPKNFRIVATARSISPENYATSLNDGLKYGHS